MEFYAVANQKRPVRLSHETREFAWESLKGKYGDDAMKTPYVPLDHIDGFELLSPLKQYDLAIKEIAQKAPLRICKNEKQVFPPLEGKLCGPNIARLSRLEGKRVRLRVDLLPYHPFGNSKYKHLVLRLSMAMN
ncbi:MAG TPA: hypothetical protein GXX54_02465 [Clostridiales bacterium]|nr:hypothetical protein [Clostridiales bacterium]